MADRPDALGHASRRVLAGSTAATLVAAPLAAQYAVLTLELPRGSTAVFLVLVAIAAAIAGQVANIRALRAVPAVKEISNGGTQQDLLLRALRQLDGLPMVVFRQTFQHMLLAAVLVITGVALFIRGVPPGTYVRVIALGLMLAPMVAFFGAFATAVTTRPLVRRIAGLGLTARQVYAAIPARHQRLRLWIVAATATYALTTAAMVMDASLCSSDREMESLLAEKDPARRHQIAEESANRSTLPLIVLTLMGAATAVATAAVVGKSLSDPMREIAAQAERISRGELGTPELIPADEEVWLLSATFAGMQEQLGGALSQLQTAGVRLASSSSQLLETFKAQEDGATEQGAALNETSATTEELARSGGQIAENAAEVEKMAARTLVAVEAGEKSAEAFFASMLRMRNDNQAVADAVVKLNKRVAQITRIIEFIDGIADKSDLLALNAELEGTKAGEVGRGFSLVAAEMRRLAENVLRSTREIEAAIQEIRDATHAAVMATEAGVKATDRGTSSANEVLVNLREIFQLARETAEAVRQISLATAQQQTGTHQLADSMAEILRITEASSQATKQMRAANVDLTTLANDLGGAVTHFTAARQDRHG